MQIKPAELWIVEPPAPSEAFLGVLGYLINAGIDFAFGPGDVLPKQPPESLEGIKAVFVTENDVPRVRHALRGFRGFYPDGDQPWNRGPGSEAPPAFHPAVQGICIALHENNTTWLVICSEKHMAKLRWLEYCLFIPPDLTLHSPALRQKLVARSDAELHEFIMERILQSEQMDRTDVATGRYYLGKILLDAAEITGNERFAIAFEDHARRMLADKPWPGIGGFAIGLVNFMWMYQRTGEPEFRDAVLERLDGVGTGFSFTPGSARWCHGWETMTSETQAVIGAQEGGMGTYGEQMGQPLALMRVARFVGRQTEFSDIVARYVKALEANLRDPDTGLYAHGIAARGLPGTMGHGTGWCAVGLAQILDDFPLDHPEREDLVRIFASLCQAAAAVQSPQGGFHSILNWHSTPVNEHYTSWLSFAFLHGARMGYLDSSFREKGLTGWHALKSRLFRGGFVCAAGGTGVSKRMEYYLLRMSNVRLQAFKLGPAFVQELLVLQEALRIGS